MNLRILYQDEHLVAVDKPAGFHVHPPEDETLRISPNFNSLHLLKKQLGKYLYPVHRLDRATSGVLIFALQSETARLIAKLFQNRQIKKTYYCVVRGWTSAESGTIDRPLAQKKGGEVSSPKVPALTNYTRVAHVELPIAVGRYSTARYSLVRVEPVTGRMHQIRRHFASISHPLIGDTVYGVGEHNRVFRQNLGISGLLLKAYSLELQHPVTGEMLQVTARWNGIWHKVFDLFGQCPYGTYLMGRQTPD